MPGGGAKENLSVWINKLGGQMRLDPDDNVNLVVIDMQRTATLISDYVAWRETKLMKSANQGRSVGPNKYDKGKKAG